jgi:type IV pilus assembly protein PilM
MVEWNKEIKFSLRKKKDSDLDEFEELEPEPEQAEAAEEQPLTEAPEPGPVATEPERAEPAPEPEPEPVPEPAAVAPSLVPGTAPAQATQVVQAPKPEKKSILKKELSFKRKEKKQPLLEEDRGLDEDEKDSKRGRKRGSKGASSSRRRVKKLVGLKIGGSQIAAARVVNNGVPELVQVAREDLDQPIVVGGELREPELLAETLRAFFKKNNLPRQGVRLGIANNRIGVRVFEVAGIEDPRQLENAIRFRAQEVLPIPIEEAVLDYHVLGERVGEDGTTIVRVLLVVAYRELIDRYVSACKKAGIRLVGIDLEAFALLRALAEPRTGDEGSADAAVVVVAIGRDRSTFAVSDGRVCEFTRVLDWGGGTLDVAIAREIDVAPSEAEPIKREISLASENVPEGLTDEQAQAVCESVRRQLQTFARELVSSLQFYQNQPGSLGIGEIVITGGTAHLAGLAEELQKLIGVRVTVGDPLTRVRLGKKVREAEQVGSLAVAIGLAIED